jgi:hypothetical protein
MFAQGKGGNSIASTHHPRPAPRSVLSVRSETGDAPGVDIPDEAAWAAAPTGHLNARDLVYPPTTGSSERGSEPRAERRRSASGSTNGDDDSRDGHLYCPWTLDDELPPSTNAPEGA